MLSIFQTEYLTDEHIYALKSQSSQNSMLHYWCCAIDTKYVWIIQFIHISLAYEITELNQQW